MENFNAINKATQIKHLKTAFIECFLFILLFLLHVHMSLDFSDDANFTKALDGKTMLSYMEYCYFNINGKVVLDLFAAIFTRINPLIWKVINSPIFLIVINAVYKFSRIFNVRPMISHWLGGGCILAIGLLTLCFPFNYLSSAGWCATSINYIWPLCFMLIALFPVQEMLTYESPCRHCQWIYVIAAFIAANQEQSGAILWTVYLLVILYCMAIQKKIPKQILLLYIIVSLTLLFMFLSPGQSARINDFSIFRIPEWNMLSFIEKLQFGLTSTSAQVFFRKNYLYLYFTMLLAYNVFYSSNNTLIRSCGIFPLVIYLSSNLLTPIHKLFSYSPPWGYGLPDFRPINVRTFLDLKYYLPTFFTFLIIGAIIISFIHIWESWRERAISTLIFSAGLVSRIIMGFSPTLYGSSYRTFTYLYFSIIICNYILLIKIHPKKELLNYFL